jgi:3-isopropylmalate/(R)-2-methylmalate dehydratase small subunit
MPSVKGRVWKFGDHVDTDAMIPGKYLASLSDPQQLAPHCMEILHPAFAREAGPGDIVVAGRNFGCGSSRPGAMVLQAKGIACIVAHSFSRLFLRNGIGIGLPLVECPEAAAAIQEGDVIEVDWEAGTIANHTRGESYRTRPFPPFLREMLEAGGVIGYARRRLELAGGGPA